jgi:hypothetical protein
MVDEKTKLTYICVYDMLGQFLIWAVFLALFSIICEYFIYPSYDEIDFDLHYLFFLLFFYFGGKKFREKNKEKWLNFLKNSIERPSKMEYI